MSDIILHHTPYLDLVERDGWYYFARVPSLEGGVAILLYRHGSALSVLGRYEMCPAHGDTIPALTAIAGGIELGHTPLTTAVIESREEAGYTLIEDNFISLGTCMLSTNQDTVIHLFAANVTDKQRSKATGDGTRGEVGAYCDWITAEAAIESKSAYMATLIARLRSRTGIDLLSVANLYANIEKFVY